MVVNPDIAVVVDVVVDDDVVVEKTIVCVSRMKDIIVCQQETQQYENCTE
jgi:hypothetical protein